METIKTKDNRKGLQADKVRTFNTDLALLHPVLYDTVSAAKVMKR